MNLLSKVLQRYSLSDYETDLAFTYANVPYQIVGPSPGGLNESPANSFTGYIQSMYKSNGIVFACCLVRQLVFSDARLMWIQHTNGRPGDLFGTPELTVLERPWPNGTTRELLSRMEQDTTLAGNFYAVRERMANGQPRLRRLRPDWVQIVLSAPPEEALASDVAGYQYTPGGQYGKGKPEIYLPEEVAHWSPIPDPSAQYRGMSWLTPITREVMADKTTLQLKQSFFDNAATPQLAVSVPADMDKEQFEEFIEVSERKHTGVRNAYRTLYLGGGADVTVVGKDLKELDYSLTQAQGEVRIAAAARVPPSLVGLVEGLRGSALNSGNFDSARRSFADGTIRPQWGSACGALEVLVALPNSAARLWYDDRNVAFLREDRKDVAVVQQTQAAAIKSLIDAGFDAASVINAIDGEDMKLLKHTGLFSVQLQPPGTDMAPNAVDPAPASSTAPADDGDGDEPQDNARRPFNLEVHAHFPEGAVRAGDVVFQPGAIDARTTLEAGAVDARTSIAEGAVRVAMPKATAKTKEITVKRSDGTTSSITIPGDQ